MLKRLGEKLRGLMVEPVAYDPSGLGDPVATQTAWSPAKGGGANFRTHALIRVNPTRMEFRASLGARLFHLVFLIVGLGMVAAFSISVLSGDPAGMEAGTASFVPLFLGLVFAIAGGAMWYFGAAPIVFDKSRGEYWKGRVAPYEASNRRNLDHYAKLDQVHAVQLISEHLQSDKSSYYSHELNLVLGDGTRMNVVDHGDRSRLRDDAQTLAAFLERPVWDATR
jgi:hypothetical protein